jgi:DNA primase
VIPAGFLQDLLSRVDIVDVVGRHVELKRGGANLMGLCPFHAEKSPSFSVSPAKQFYYCFGCGASGDAIRFLTEHTGMSFVDAVTELAQTAGMQVPQEQVSPEERERRQRLVERRLSLTDALQRAARHYRTQLRDAPAAVGYLKARGLSGEIAARFGLGYAPQSWHGLASVFPNYDDPVLEEAGLVRSRGEDGEASAEERRRYDWFRHRIMFPIRAVGGEVIGFGARVLDDSKPKYLNSPETPVFSKGRELYGLYEARQAIRERGFALVVEGYMDVVALAQASFGNAVATLGTACTAEHIQKLFRFTDSVVFSFDGDEAGRRAAGRALEAALPLATDLRQVRFLFLPPEHDPDSYVRTLGAAAFEQAIDQAVPLSRQLLAQASADGDMSSAEGRARMLAHARPLWAALPDGALQRQLVGDLARAAQMTPQDLAAMWQIGPAQAPSPAGRPARPAPVQPPRRQSRIAGRPVPTASAELALRLLLRHSDWWDRMTADDHQLLHALGGEHAALVAWLEQQVTDHGPQTWAALADALMDHDLAATATRIADLASLDDRHEFDDLQRVLHRLWIDDLFAQAQQLSHAGPLEREQLERIAAINERIRQHKQLLAAPSAPVSGSHAL